MRENLQVEILVITNAHIQNLAEKSSVKVNTFGAVTYRQAQGSYYEFLSYTLCTQRIHTANTGFIRWQIKS
jgi:hypothetical protein